MTRRAIVVVAVAAVLVGNLAVATAAQRKRPPAPKVQVLEPSVDAELVGTVSVRIRITAPDGIRLPSSAFVGLGGQPWIEMDKLENEWAAKFDSTMVPNGPQVLIVITDNKRARAEVKVSVKNPLKHYFADLHSHTGYSDGTLLPSHAHDYARNIAKLDVFSLTDHLESVDDAEWIDTRNQALRANDDGAFVVIPGLEWTKKWGHINIFDPKTRHWPTDPAEFYKAAADAGVILKFNHPGDGSKTHDGLAYSEVGDRAMQMMEVRHPDEEKAFIRALKNGWHIAPEGSDDTHSPNWGNCGRWTVILAPGLSQRNIWDALMNRRCYSTLDRNCLMHFSVNGAVMGDIVKEPVPTVDVLVAVDEADDKDLIAKIELFEDGEIVETVEPKADTGRMEVTRLPAVGKHFYFAKVTQVDGNLMWSAPVWVTVAEKTK